MCLSNLQSKLVVRCLTFWGDQSFDTAGCSGRVSSGCPIHHDRGKVGSLLHSVGRPVQNERTSVIATHESGGSLFSIPNKSFQTLSGINTA